VLNIKVLIKLEKATSSIAGNVEAHIKFWELVGDGKSFPHITQYILNLF
jgi:hypothetical protein